MTKYVDSCLSLEILKQDSGLLPKPKEDWNTFIPKEGDIAFVYVDNSEYIFKEGEWVAIDMKKILAGSSYFFKEIPEFKSKDTDWVVLTDHPVGFRSVRQTSGLEHCLFEWRKMSADEFVEYTLNTKLPMSAGKFLIPEFNSEIGFTLEHLKKLEPIFNKMDIRHKYEKVIFDSYIENNGFYLTEEQRLKAYEIYKEARK